MPVAVRRERPRGGRSLRAARGLLSAAAALGVAAGALVACTGEPKPDARSTTQSRATGAPGAAQQTTAADAATPTTRIPDGAAVVDARDLEKLSVGVTEQLFTSAPAVVVAAADDQAGIDEAAKLAEQAGAPLLLSGASGAVAGGVLSGELRRLEARTVLAVGSLDPAGLANGDGLHVVTDASELPETSAAPRVDGLTVLVRSDGGARVRRGATAARASAQAAGAEVVAVAGTDPRRDREAIAALAKRPPSRVVAVGGFGPAVRLERRIAVASTGAELPGGGQVMFPGRRLVALYGHPETPGLGVLGEQGLAASVRRAKSVAAAYDPLSDVPVVPTFEIIATVAQGGPGSDGNYSGETAVDLLRPWVDRAGKEGVYVVLDLQPGRADFLAQAKLYEPLLKLPHVGLALDPEWKLKPGQRPLQQIGGVDAAEVNRVLAWLARLTASERLPQKLVVLHQFKLSMLRDEKDIDTSHDELSVLIHMDGQGAPALKHGTWQAILPAAPRGMGWWGWKNFYDEDSPTMTPKETLAKRPQPVMISYQ